MKSMDRKIYGPIALARHLDIIVILDENKTIYEGNVDEAPEEVRKLKYSKVEMEKPIKYYVYSEFNK